jgi:2-hydroxychromene-2-carboxylate isomerase
MSSPTVVRFHFDYISPNAYLAWTQLPALAARHGYAIDPVPVLFAGLLGAHGGLGPAEMPAKALWMSKNNFRKATVLGVPLNPPAFHPFNPLLALRVTSLPDDAATRATITTALMEAVWVRGLHVSEPTVVTRVCDEAGLDGTALVAAAAEPAAKARLRRQTDASRRACSAFLRCRSAARSSGATTTFRTWSCCSPGRTRSPAWRSPRGRCRSRRRCASSTVGVWRQRHDRGHPRRSPAARFAGRSRTTRILPGKPRLHLRDEQPCGEGGPEAGDRDAGAAHEQAVRHEDETEHRREEGRAHGPCMQLLPKAPAPRGWSAGAFCPAASSIAGRRRAHRASA